MFGKTHRMDFSFSLFSFVVFRSSFLVSRDTERSHTSVDRSVLEQHFVSDDLLREREPNTNTEKKRSENSAES